MSKPLTPYARLIAAEDMTEKVKDTLKEEHLAQNPIARRKALRKKLMDFRLYNGQATTKLGKYAV